MKLAMGAYVGGVDGRGWYEKRSLEGNPNIRVLVRPLPGWRLGAGSKGERVVEAWDIKTGQYWIGR